MVAATAGTVLEVAGFASAWDSLVVGIAVEQAGMAPAVVAVMARLATDLAAVAAVTDTPVAAVLAARLPRPFLAASWSCAASCGRAATCACCDWNTLSRYSATRARLGAQSVTSLP